MKPQFIPSVLSLLVVAVFVSAPSLSAVPIVTWGPSPDYVGSFTNATGLSGGVVPFSATAVRNPGSPYPNGQPSGTYYGGAQSQNGGGISLWRVGNGSSGSDDFLNFASELDSGESATAAFLWTQPSFLNGLDTGNISLASSNAFSASLNVTGGASMVGAARWLIQVNGNYYLSSAFSLGTARTTYSLGNVSTTQWFAYDPATSLTTVGDLWASPEFSSLSAVGVWMQTMNNGASTVAIGEGRLYSFEAYAVPEPGTWTCLGLALLALVMRRNRKGLAL